MTWKTDRLQTRLNFPVEILEEVFTMLAKIDSVKQSWAITGNLQPQIIERLTQSVIITSTGASNRIEGNQLNDDDVEKLYKRLRIQKPRTIEASVKRLLEYKFIERIGVGRGTRYRFLR